MTRSLLLLAASILSLSAAEPVPFLELDKDRSLAGIFKAGLRPWRVWGLENRDCEIRPPVVASFKAAGVTIPPIKAAWEFSFNGKSLFQVKGITEEAWTAEEAYDVVAPLERELGGNPAGLLQWLQGYPQTSLNGDMWGVRKQRGKTSVGYYFRHSFNDTRPFLLTILIQWEFTPAEIVRNSEPLQPPPGFEDFDMRPAGARTMDGPDGKRQAHRASPPAPEALPGRSTGAVGKDGSHGSSFSDLWWLWLAMALLAIAAVSLGRKLRRRRTA